MHIVFWLTVMVTAMHRICPGADLPSESAPAAETMWHDHAGIPGTLIIRGGAIPQVPGELQKLGLTSDTAAMIVRDGSAESADAAREASDCLGGLGLSPQTVLLDMTPAARDSDNAAGSRLAESLERAGLIWFVGGSAGSRTVSPLPPRLQEALQGVLRSGGVVVSTAAEFPGVTGLVVTRDGQEVRIGYGLDLLPGAVMAGSSSGREQDADLAHALRIHQGCFGIAIDRHAALIVHGRRMRAAGSGQVRLYLPHPKPEQAEIPEFPVVIQLSAGAEADLTQIRRAAQSRAAGGWQMSGPPDAAAGAVMLVGGGEIPAAAADRYLELAGGSQAVIAVLPLGLPSDDPTADQLPSFLNAAKQVIVLPHAGAAAVSSAEFRDALNQATGVWFGGGRQWRFVDAYEGTAALPLFHEVMQRGGVIGGSSAGATIQGDYLVRGHPLGNSIVMAEGYEQGFGFLPGTAIDQHFSQRGRKADLVRVIERFPELLGIGIDEATAVVVRRTSAEILGRHAVHFISFGSRESHPEGGRPAGPDRITVLTVPAGRTIDLKTLQTLPSHEE